MAVKKMTKKLVRPEQGRILGGVCIGLANYFDKDVTLIRLIFALLLVPGGLPGLIPYIICWIVIPSEN